VVSGRHRVLRAEAARGLERAVVVVGGGVAVARGLEATMRRSERVVGRQMVVGRQAVGSGQ